MIEAQMRGRSLALVVTDPDDEQFHSEPFIIRPVSASTGRQLSFRYLMAVNGLPLPEGYSIEQDIRDVFGVENMLRVEQELTVNEGELLTQAGYMWNLIGGTQAVQALLQLDGDGMQGGVDAAGEALTAFKLRMVPLLSQISHLSESGRRTRSRADSPATSTRPDGESAESELGTEPSEPPKASPTSRGSRSARTTGSGSSLTP